MVAGAAIVERRSRGGGGGQRVEYARLDRWVNVARVCGVEWTDCGGAKMMCCWLCEAGRSQARGAGGAVTEADRVTGWANRLLCRRETGQ